MKKALLALTAAVLAATPIAANAGSWHMPEFIRKTCSYGRQGYSAYDSGYKAGLYMFGKYPSFANWVTNNEPTMQRILARDLSKYCPDHASFW
jgi:opacity protein-like surface antigen